MRDHRVSNLPSLEKPLIQGTLPLDIRFKVPNEDGSVSTVRTISIGTDQGEVLIPTVVNGRILSDEDAIQHYMQTGEMFGVFRTPDAATAYAQWLHNKHQAELAKTPIKEILGQK